MTMVYNGTFLNVFKSANLKIRTFQVLFILQFVLDKMGHYKYEATVVFLATNRLLCQSKNVALLGC